MPYFTREYTEHLQSQYWHDLRMYVFDEWDYHCAHCGKHTLQLELDHLHYRTLGHENPWDVQPLCHPCHAKKTTSTRKQRARRYKKRSRGGLGGFWRFLFFMILMAALWIAVTAPRYPG